MPASPRTALVVASNRMPELTTFLRLWGIPEASPWTDVIVVEDQPAKSPGLPDRVAHYSWAEIEGDPQVSDWEAFSRRDSAIKCYGLYKAVTAHQAEYVYVLDDDCLPPEAGPHAWHAAMLQALTEPVDAWAPSIPDYPTRGVPYHRHAGPVSRLHMATWRQVCDLDGPQSLQAMRGQLAQYGHPLAAFDPPQARTLAHPHLYYPVCGMSWIAHRDAVPACYFPRQGEGVPFRRFDDIWWGILFQRIFRHLGWSWTLGGPSIVHSRASNAFVNTVKEAHGIHANEVFFRLVDSVNLAGTTDPLVALKRLGEAFRGMTADHAVWAQAGPEAASLELRTYVPRLGAWITVWTEAFAGAGWPAA